ncbi:MAG: rRNA maturation RNase YbeY [Dehalococcoidia bacterium]|nr:MAG: rRNA maturation RNase YbeY [Dehalococcoidia bacterium]
MEINVLIDEDLEAYLEAGWLEEVARQVLTAEPARSDAELSLVITGQERIRQLNRDYLGRDRPTDVLAFSMLAGLPAEGKAGAPPFVTPPDGVLHLGEVIISYPQAVIQAEEHQHPVSKEIALLVIHGVLHLLGYDDEKPEKKRRMRAREKEILPTIKVD